MSSIPALPARWFVRLLALLLPALTVALPAAAAEDEFLPVRSAFKVSLAAEPNVLVVDLEIAPGYYLYRDRLGFESATPGVTLGQPTLPVGLDHEDEFFGKQVIYRDMARVGVPVTFAGAAQDFDVKVKLQGCADAGLCYPPQTWTLRATWPAARRAMPRRRLRRHRLPARRAAGSTCARSSAAAPSPTPTSCRWTRPLCCPARARRVIASSCAGTLPTSYYLYRDKVTVKTAATDVQLGKLSIPGGESKHDEYFGEQVVFHGEMVADLPVAAAAGVTSVPLEISYQGCADAGLCYPPVKKTVVVQLASTAAVAAAPAAAASRRCVSEQDLLADKIREGSLLAVIGCSSSRASGSRSRPASGRWCRFFPASSSAPAAARRSRAVARSRSRSLTCWAWPSPTRWRGPRLRPLDSRPRRSSRSPG